MGGLLMAAARRSDPLSIFAGSNLLWIDAKGGTFLRDSGNNVPSDGEAVVTAVDRGNVGNSTSSGSGVTYSASAFGSRGGLSFAGGSSDYFTTPSWVLNGRCSGGLVWRPTTGGARGAWNHGAVNTRTGVFWNANLAVARRIDGAGSADASFARTAGVDAWMTWRLQDSDGECWGDGTSGTSATNVTIPTSSATTIIGSFASGVAPFVGTLGVLVLVDTVMTEAQRLALQSYLEAWGGL